MIAITARMRVAGLLMVLAMVGCTSPSPSPSSPALPAADADDRVVAKIQAQASVNDADFSSPPRLRVVGTEPFWGIAVDGERLHFTTMDDQAGRELTASPIVQGVGWRWSGGEANVMFVLTIEPGACSDGMSDRSYAYRARFKYDRAEYRGCADAADAFSGEGQ